jgi:hypothetical protein
MSSLWKKAQILLDWVCRSLTTETTLTFSVWILESHTPMVEQSSSSVEESEAKGRVNKDISMLEGWQGWHEDR